MSEQSNTNTIIDPVALFESRQQMPAPEKHDPMRQPGVKLSANEGARVYNTGGEATAVHSRHGSYNTAEAVGDGSAGILSTARSPSGSHRAASQLGPKDSVTIDGMQTSVEVAERLGYLVKDPDTGRYREGAPQEPEATAGPEAGSETAAVALSDSGAESFLGQIVGGMSASTQVAALMQVVETGAVDRGTIERAASELGMHPHQLGAGLSGIISAFETQASKAVQAAGVSDPGEFFAWAQQNQPKAFNEAMKRHGMERTTAGYTALVNQYHAAASDGPGAGADAHADDVLNATFDNGVTARRAQNGKVVLNLPGFGEVEYGVAVKQGIITVGRR